MAHFPRSSRLVLRVALGLLTLGVLVGIAVPAGIDWDFANFYDTGRRIWAGQLGSIYDPSTLIAGQAPQGGMAFWGAPASAYVYAPLAWLPPAAALIAFKIVASTALVTALLLLFRETASELLEGSEARADYAALFAVLALVFQPFWTIYRVGGQTTPVVFLLIVVGFLAYQKDRRWTAAFALAIASFLKPAFLLVPAILALLGGRRTFLTIAGSFAVLGLLSVAFLGWPIHREFIEVLARGSEKPARWYFNSALSILADPFRPAEGAPAAGGVYHLVARGIRLLGLGVLLWVAFARRQMSWSDGGRRRVDYLLAAGFALLLSQVVWEHYLTVLFLPLILLVPRRAELPEGARRLLWGSFALCLLQNLILVLWARDHVPALRVLPGMALAVLLKSGPLLLLLLLLLRYHLDIFRVVGNAPLRSAPNPVTGGTGELVPAGTRAR
jgi:hypothetical protein